MLRSEAKRLNALRHAYRRASKQAGDKGTTAEVDLFVDDGPAGRPLVVFHHVQKTAGTAMRFVIAANHRQAEHRIARLPKHDDRATWWRELYESTTGGVLACVAGHEAAYLLEVVHDRPVEASTLVREPVDRVLSRYFFFTEPKWSLEEYFESLESDPFAHPARLRAFCNAQALGLLAPRYDVRKAPPTADDPAADLWRGRLFELVEQHYLLGVQERFRESVELFAKTFGWSYRRDHKVRVNRDRAQKPLPPARTLEQIRRFNWLDAELHELALARVAPRKRFWERSTQV